MGKEIKLSKEAPILEIDPTSNFFFELAYIRGEDVVHQYLEYPADAMKVANAIVVIREFQEALDAAGLLNQNAF